MNMNMKMTTVNRMINKRAKYDLGQLAEFHGLDAQELKVVHLILATYEFEFDECAFDDDSHVFELIEEQGPLSLYDLMSIWYAQAYEEVAEEAPQLIAAMNSMKEKLTIL